MKFTCLVTGAMTEKPMLWHKLSDCNALAIRSQQPLDLQFKTEEQGLMSIPVFLGHSRIVSLRSISELQPQEFIVDTVDVDFYPDGGWWLDEHIGLLICRTVGNRPTITLNVHIALYEFNMI